MQVLVLILHFLQNFTFIIISFILGPAAQQIQYSKLKKQEACHHHSLDSNIPTCEFTHEYYSASFYSLHLLLSLGHAPNIQFVKYSYLGYSKWICHQMIYLMLETEAYLPSQYDGIMYYFVQDKQAMWVRQFELDCDSAI